jgi:hypothetical protein
MGSAGACLPYLEQVMHAEQVYYMSFAIPCQQTDFPYKTKAILWTMSDSFEAVYGVLYTGL